MTHEFKKIIQEYIIAKGEGLTCILATVVALDGSSYRRPGVRMLIKSNHEMVGAVSGGCVEKEVLFQAQSVFETKIAKVMTYDGRYRLGCEGILYILLEPFSPSDDMILEFGKTIAERKSFELTSAYAQEVGIAEHFGTLISLPNNRFPLHNKTQEQPQALQFTQQMQPCKRLLIIGGEHDAVQLSRFALSLGWEVTVAVTPKEDKLKEDFPGIDLLLNYEPENLPVQDIDSDTAIVLMTHSYAKDLKYLLALQHSKPMYLGLLGPSKRREKLLDALLEQNLDIPFEFVEGIHGPAGLNIGAETPQEIAISILSEILTVIRKTNPIMLKDKEKSIHH